MATSTTNLNLSKPAYTDPADIAVINDNMDKLDGAVNGVEDGLAIVANGNTHAAVAAGQFVYVRNHSSLAQGVYKATTAIAANGALSTSNLTADASGGLNALKADIDTLNSNLNNLIKSKTFSVKTANGGFVDIGAQNLGYARNKCIILAFVTDIATGDTVFGEIGVYRATANAWTMRFKQGDSPITAGVTFNLTLWYVVL